jgi:predicted Fe-S protein YdhL (DUF1289 family)
MEQTDVKQQSIKNPCIRKCKYNDDRICISCFRTQQEVYFWGDFSEEKKTEILHFCAERKIGLEKNK